MFLNLSALLPHSVTGAAHAVICNRQEAVLLRSLSSGQGILIAASLPSEMLSQRPPGRTLCYIMMGFLSKGGGSYRP